MPADVCDPETSGDTTTARTSTETPLDVSEDHREDLKWKTRSSRSKTILARAKDEDGLGSCLD